MRRGFTLIELLVIVTILATMVTIGVGSIASGQGMARVKGATRDVYAAIRHARSTALVTGQRVRITYSNVTIDDEPAIRIETVGAKIMSADSSVGAEPYYVERYADLRKSGSAKGDSSGGGGGGGESLEEILFSPMDPNVVKGMRVKVEKGQALLADETEVQRGYRISVGSNASGIFEKYDSLSNSTAAAAAPSPSADAPESDVPGPVNVVWETNGAVEPHRVWVYAVGKKPEEGLVLDVDRYGAIKVQDGSEE